MPSSCTSPPQRGGGDTHALALRLALAPSIGGAMGGSVGIHGIFLGLKWDFLGIEMGFSWDVNSWDFLGILLEFQWDFFKGFFMAIFMAFF